MSGKKISPKKPTVKRRAERELIPLRYCLLTLACGFILVVGFFFAARQHFSSIDYGIKNSRLKKQIGELETDKRQLILAKEIALTPSEIKKAATKLGLTAMTASNIEVFRPTVTSDTGDKPKIEKADYTKPKTVSPPKTGDAKPEVKKAEKETKKTPEAKTEKEKPAAKTMKK